MHYKSAFIFLILFLAGFVSADDITLNYPVDADSCIVGAYINLDYTPNDATIDSCYLYSNVSGSWGLRLFNTSVSSGGSNVFNDSTIPGMILWGVRCTNSSGTDFYSANQTYQVVKGLYCAVLADTSCDETPNLNGEMVVKTRLSNTRGFYLQNQDGNVFITDSNGKVVKTFNSMLYNQETNIQLDAGGNWINTAEVKTPLTDSNGYYVFPFMVDGSWAWVDDEYSVHVSINGQETTCNFTVQSEKLPDMVNYQKLGDTAAGILVLIGLGLIILIKYGSHLFEILKKVIN